MPTPCCLHTLSPTDGNEPEPEPVASTLPPILRAAVWVLIGCGAAMGAAAVVIRLVTAPSLP